LNQNLVDLGIPNRFIAKSSRARIHAVMKPFGILVKLKDPIDFDAIDGQPVDLVFVLLLPAAADGDQLGALASGAGTRVTLPASVKT
jgi:phosphoenolpyruvate-dependent sugar phosphotransferase system EIIA component